MAFFHKRETEKTTTLKVEGLKVATTTIISNYTDITGPRNLRWYFLVREEDGKYYEIFSNKEIEKEASTNYDGFTNKTFYTPYIEELEPLAKYLANPKRKEVELRFLFDFILDKNVQERIEEIEKLEEEKY